MITFQMINKDNLQEYILSFILFAIFLVLSKITSLWRIVYVVHHAHGRINSIVAPPPPGKAVH
jgi:hypothetical protein